MRLINVEKKELESFGTAKKPDYAILSHRWSQNEVTFQDISTPNFEPEPSFQKFIGTLRQAKQDNLQYVWIDTCCIDKRSSAELGETINSMYDWYQHASVCYVYLYDVDSNCPQKPFTSSEWFERGWTLQELLAPKNVRFYDREWRFLGDKIGLAAEITEATDIDKEVLESGNWHKCCVAQKMAWAATRTTTRVEDQAYCLMGLFEVNMTPMYGEKERAFLRLQEEIIKTQDDHSIFSWQMSGMRFSGLLAPAPACFRDCHRMEIHQTTEAPKPFSMTNIGLAIALQVTPWATDTYLALLEVTRNHKRVGILLRRLGHDDQYMRVKIDGQDLVDIPAKRPGVHRPVVWKQIYVRQKFRFEGGELYFKECIYGFMLSRKLSSLITTRYGSTVLGYVAFLPEFGWHCIADIPFPHESGAMQRILLGFDLEFNPVCILQASCNPNELHFKWSDIAFDDFEWDTTMQRGRAYKGELKGNCWSLRGDRLTGLDVRLCDRHGNERGPIICFKRVENESRTFWKFDIDNPDDLYISFQQIIAEEDHWCDERGTVESGSNIQDWSPCPSPDI